MSIEVVVQTVLLASIVLVGWLAVSASAGVQVRLVQAIAALLALSAVGTAIEFARIWPLVIVIVPIGFACSIKAIFEFIDRFDAHPTRSRAVHQGSRQRLHNARKQRTIRPRYVVLAVGVTAGVMAIQLTLSALPPILATGIEPLRLATAIALVLAGASVWFFKPGLAPQAIGLLIMDDGFSLLCESLVVRLGLTDVILLVVGCYAIVPLTCLLAILPKLRQQGFGLHTDHVSSLKG